MTRKASHPYSWIDRTPIVVAEGSNISSDWMYYSYDSIENAWDHYADSKKQRPIMVLNFGVPIARNV